LSTKPQVIDLSKVTQGQLEAYFKAFREYGGNDEAIGVIEYAGAMARAAVKVGWLALDVDNANPRDVLELQRVIQDYVKGVFDVDPKN